MKRIWVLIGSVVLGSSTGLAASSGAPLKTDEEVTSPEAAKAAARDASSEADKWAASVKTQKNTVAVEEPEIKEETKPAVKADATPPARTPGPVDTDKLPDAKLPPVAPAPVAQKAAVPALPKRTGLNEIRGKLLSKSYDPKAIRLVVTGGINVEFAYDQKTTIQTQGAVLSMEDLGYDDVLAVRYAGKDLYALEVERLSKARRPE